MNTGTPLGSEPLKTTHRILQAFDREARGLEWLHADIFDSRVEVALSALEAVASLADSGSFPHVTRVLASGSGELAAAAVRALGRIRHPGAGRALVGLLKTTRDESLRREILDALALAVPKDHELAALVRQLARSPLVSPGARAHAVGLLLRLRGEAALDDVLNDSREETVDQVLRAAAEMPALCSRVVAAYAPRYAHLPARSRAALVSLALTQDLVAARELLGAALCDPVADVRRAAYGAVATAPHHHGLFPVVIESLLGRTETTTALEDEVQEAIDRMARAGEAAPVAFAGLAGRALGLVRELFSNLREEGRRISDESHELGWLIMKSREYVEFYCDDDFKAALLRYLKGVSTDTDAELLKRLKATAVRVEVRHFDGYTALAELIGNPRRTGIALVARELALAKPGKGVIFWQLIRAVRLLRVILTPSAGPAAGAPLRDIYAWARDQKLFRLAEAALWAIARVDAPAAVSACSECLTQPLASKVLAIASLHLLRELRPAELEPAAARLLAGQDDPYITLNAMEALSAFPATAGGDLARALLSRLSFAANREVIEALSTCLGDKVSLDIMEMLRDMYAGADPAHRAAVLAIIGRRITCGFPTNRDGMVEFLYKILRGTDSPCRRAAGILLWRLRDDYAPEVTRDFLSAGSEEERAETIRGLKGHLRSELLPFLAPLLASESPVIHEPLRDLLLGAPEDLHAGVLDLALQLRGAPQGTEAEPGLPEEPGPAVDFRVERRAFQFERENIQDLVILFTDIQGYSRKAQSLTPLQLSALIQDYEKILLALAEAHRGELVKRMGDGHLFVFHEPLAAVLAAIRLQKSLRRFNRYRDEVSRVVVRVGIHCGKVVRRERGDVLGNTVNIASRLESSAQPGSILVSEQVHDRVKDHVHAREIGRITVKNIAEPIRVYEPYEVALDLPSGLDPLKARKADRPEAAPAKEAASVVPVDAAVLRQITACFESLSGLCREARDGKIPLDPVARQVLSRWEHIRSRLPASADA